MKAVRTKNNTNEHMALSFSDGGWPGRLGFSFESNGLKRRRMFLDY